MLQTINNKRIFLWGFLVIAITSCRVGKDYKRPELALPAQFSPLSFSDTSSIADIEWQQFFADPALVALIEKGIAYNYDLFQAVKRIDIAHLQYRQSKNLQLPTAVLAFTGQVYRPSENSLNGLSVKNFLGKSYVENYNAAVTLSWEADIWGKLRGRKEFAKENYIMTQEEAKAVQTLLVADIAQGYYNLQMLDRQLEISHRNLVLNDSFLVVTKMMMNAGLGTALAVQRAEAQKQTVALLIPNLEQEIGLQENALQELTGQLPGTITRTSAFEMSRPPQNLSAGLPISMVSRRPDVRFAELSLMMANTQVGIASANMYPALNLTAGGGLESFKSSNWFNIPGSLFGVAAGTIAQPIFRRRELKTDFEIAKVEREAAVARFRQSVLQATVEVSDALVQLEKLKQQEQIASSQVDTLRQAVQNAYLLFQSDMADYLDVITAQANAVLAELNYASIQRQQFGAMVELYRSLGGGWK